MRAARQRRLEAPCALCWHRTLHDVVHTIRVRRVDWRDQYDTMQCNMCGTVSLRHRQKFKDWDEPLIHFYPSERSRWWPEWTLIGEVSDGVKLLLNEVYIANEEKLFRIAFMGLRAALEQVIIERVGDNGSFIENLTKLKEKGHISLLQFDQISAVLDAGHAVTHRAFQPEQHEIEKALDVVERVLATMFMHNDEVNALTQRVPPRPSRRPGRMQGETGGRE